MLGTLTGTTLAKVVTMITFFFSLMVAIGFGSDIPRSDTPNCRALMKTIPYSEYAQLRLAHDPSASSANVVTQYEKRSFTFWLGFSAKQYIESTAGSHYLRQPHSKLNWIHQEPGSPKVYLSLTIGSGDREKSRLTEFDLRTRKSRLLLESFSALYSESLVITPDRSLAILKASYSSSYTGNRFESRVRTDSWIINLHNGQTKTIPHSEERIGLSPAGRAQIRHLRSSPMAGDIQSATIDGKTYYRGATEWIRGGEFLIHVSTVEVQVWKLNPETLQVTQVPSAVLGEEAIIVFNNPS